MKLYYSQVKGTTVLWTLCWNGIKFIPQNTVKLCECQSMKLLRNHGRNANQLKMNFALIFRKFVRFFNTKQSAQIIRKHLLRFRNNVAWPNNQVSLQVVRFGGFQFSLVFSDLVKRLNVNRLSVKSSWIVEVPLFLNSFPDKQIRFSKNCFCYAFLLNV